MNGFLIAADKSGSGKTTITTGIITFLKNKGLKVASFKCGPDYIDTSHLAYVSGVACNNLDSVMLDENELKKVFKQNIAGADIVVVEGVMGLFDGISAEEFYGSSYHVASILGLQVILVIDAASASYSISAVIKGFELLCEKVKIAGIILNNVASDNHEKLLRESIKIYTEIPVIGCIHKQKEKLISSRHLGIKTALETDSDYYKYCSDLIKAYLNTELLENIFFDKNKITFIYKKISFAQTGLCYVAFDKSFNFYYDANLKFLEDIGFRLKYFSPLKNETVEDADFIYLGGGYPEIYAKEISENKKFLNSLRKHVRDNKPLLAECGGMMILTKGIYCNDVFYEMSGVFDAKTILTEKRQALGYVKAIKKDKEFIGHEFHYSKLIDVNEPYFFTLQKVTTGKLKKDGFFKKRTLASYVHFHFLSNPCILDLILDDSEDRVNGKRAENRNRQL
jgi:cobyrinic acid a,c-diamide synthase